MNIFGRICNLTYNIYLMSYNVFLSPNREPGQRKFWGFAALLAHVLRLLCSHKWWWNLKHLHPPQENLPI